MAQVQINMVDGRRGNFTFERLPATEWITEIERAMTEPYILSLRSVDTKNSALVNGAHITTVFYIEDEVPLSVRSKVFDHKVEFEDISDAHPSSLVCTRCGYNAIYDRKTNTLTGALTEESCGEI